MFIFDNGKLDDVMDEIFASLVLGSFLAALITITLLVVKIFLHFALIFCFLPVLIISVISFLYFLIYGILFLTNNF